MSRGTTNKNIRKSISLFTAGVFLLTSIPVPPVFAQQVYTPAPLTILPQPGTMLGLSPTLNPPVLKGIKVFEDQPFRFEFILDPGDGSLGSDELKDESNRLIKYFLASLTVPEDELWVNLSPYEDDRIIPDSFGVTEMGRDMLAEDYILKQLTASLMYPEEGIGQEFWARIRSEAMARFGTDDIPVDTFNKVWIIPDMAEVYENPQTSTAFVVESRLRVMLEEDYLALAESGSQLSISDSKAEVNDLIREIIIPAIEQEVNYGEHFTKLRQVYNSLILAAWYKQKIQNSLLGEVYIDKRKVKGVDIEDPDEKQKIYKQYVEAFEKGVYNFVKEEYDPATQQIIPRKYFSGGLEFTNLRAGQALRTSQNPERIGDIDAGKLMSIDLRVESVDAQSRQKVDSNIPSIPKRTFGLEIELRAGENVGLDPKVRHASSVWDSLVPGLWQSLEQRLSELEQEGMGRFTMDKRSSSVNFGEIQTPPFENTEQGWQQAVDAINGIQGVVDKNIFSVHSHIAGRVDERRLARLSAVFGNLWRIAGGNPIEYTPSSYLRPISIAKRTRDDVGESVKEHNLVINVSSPSYRKKVWTVEIKNIRPTLVSNNGEGRLIDPDRIKNQVNPFLKLVDEAEKLRDDTPLALLPLPVLPGHVPTQAQVDRFVQIFYADDSVGADYIYQSVAQAKSAHEQALSQLTELQRMDLARVRQNETDEVRGYFKKMGLGVMYDRYAQAQGYDESWVMGLADNEADLRQLAIELVQANQSERTALGFFPGFLHDALRVALKDAREELGVTEPVGVASQILPKDSILYDVLRPADIRTLIAPRNLEFADYFVSPSEARFEINQILNSIEVNQDSMLSPEIVRMIQNIDLDNNIDVREMRLMKNYMNNLFNNIDRKSFLDSELTMRNFMQELNLTKITREFQDREMNIVRYDPKLIRLNDVFRTDREIIRINPENILQNNNYQIMTLNRPIEFETIVIRPQLRMPFFAGLLDVHPVRRFFNRLFGIKDDIQVGARIQHANGTETIVLKQSPGLLGRFKSKMQTWADWVMGDTRRLTEGSDKETNASRLKSPQWFIDQLSSLSAPIEEGRIERKMFLSSRIADELTADAMLMIDEQEQSDHFIEVYDNNRVDRVNMASLMAAGMFYWEQLVNDNRKAFLSKDMTEAFQKFLDDWARNNPHLPHYDVPMLLHLVLSEYTIYEDKLNEFTEALDFQDIKIGGFEDKDLQDKIFALNSMLMSFHLRKYFFNDEAEVDIFAVENHLRYAVRRLNDQDESITKRQLRMAVAAELMALADMIDIDILKKYGIDDVLKPLGANVIQAMIEDLITADSGVEYKVTNQTLDMNDEFWVFRVPQQKRPTDVLLDFHSPESQEIIRQSPVNFKWAAHLKEAGQYVQFYQNLLRGDASAIRFKQPIFADEGQLNLVVEKRSYLDRHRDQWRWIQDQAMDYLIERSLKRASDNKPKLTIVDIGASTGEEMARAFHEIETALSKKGQDIRNWEIRIVGIDNDAQVLQEAFRRLSGQKPFIRARSQDQQTKQMGQYYADMVINTLQQHYEQAIGSFQLVNHDVFDAQRIKPYLEDADLVLLNHVLRIFPIPDQKRLIQNITEDATDAIIAVGDAGIDEQVYDSDSHIFEKQETQEGFETEYSMGMNLQFIDRESAKEIDESSLKFTRKEKTIIEGMVNNDRESFTRIMKEIKDPDRIHAMINEVFKMRGIAQPAYTLYYTDDSKQEIEAGKITLNLDPFLSDVPKANFPFTIGDYEGEKVLSWKLPVVSNPGNGIGTLIYQWAATHPELRVKLAGIPLVGVNSSLRQTMALNRAGLLTDFELNYGTDSSYSYSGKMPVWEKDRKGDGSTIVSGNRRTFRWLFDDYDLNHVDFDAQYPGDWPITEKGEQELAEQYARMNDRELADVMRDLIRNDFIESLDFLLDKDNIFEAFLDDIERDPNLAIEHYARTAVGNLAFYNNVLQTLKARPGTAEEDLRNTQKWIDGTIKYKAFMREFAKRSGGEASTLNPPQYEMLNEQRRGDLFDLSQNNYVNVDQGANYFMRISPKRESEASSLNDTIEQFLFNERLSIEEFVETSARLPVVHVNKLEQAGITLEEFTDYIRSKFIEKKEKDIRSSSQFDIEGQFAAINEMLGENLAGRGVVADNIRFSLDRINEELAREKKNTVISYRGVRYMLWVPLAEEDVTKEGIINESVYREKVQHKIDQVIEGRIKVIRQLYGDIGREELFTSSFVESEASGLNGKAVLIDALSSEDKSRMQAAITEVSLMKNPDDIHQIMGNALAARGFEVTFEPSEEGRFTQGRIDLTEDGFSAGRYTIREGPTGIVLKGYLDSGYFYRKISPMVYLWWATHPDIREELAGMTMRDDDTEFPQVQALRSTGIFNLRVRDTYYDSDDAESGSPVYRYEARFPVWERDLQQTLNERAVEASTLNFQTVEEAYKVLDVFRQSRAQGQPVDTDVQIRDPYAELYRGGMFDVKSIGNSDLQRIGAIDGTNKIIVEIKNGFGLVMIDSAQIDPVITAGLNHGCCSVAVRAENLKTGQTDVGKGQIYAYTRDDPSLLDNIMLTLRQVERLNYAVSELYVVYNTETYNYEILNRSKQEYENWLIEQVSQEFPDVTIQFSTRDEDEAEEVLVFKEGIAVRKEGDIRILPWKESEASVLKYDVDLMNAQADQTDEVFLNIAENKSWLNEKLMDAKRTELPFDMLRFDIVKFDAPEQYFKNFGNVNRIMLEQMILQIKIVINELWGNAVRNNVGNRSDMQIKIYGLEGSSEAAPPVIHISIEGERVDRDMWRNIYKNSQLNREDYANPAVRRNLGLHRALGGNGFVSYAGLNQMLPIALVFKKDNQEGDKKTFPIQTDLYIQMAPKMIHNQNVQRQSEASTFSANEENIIEEMIANNRDAYSRVLAEVNDPDRIHAIVEEAFRRRGFQQPVYSEKDGVNNRKETFTKIIVNNDNGDEVINFEYQVTYEEGYLPLLRWMIPTIENNNFQNIGLGTMVYQWVMTHPDLRKKLAGVDLMGTFASEIQVRALKRSGLIKDYSENALTGTFRYAGKFPTWEKDQVQVNEEVVTEDPSGINDVGGIDFNPQNLNLKTSTSSGSGINIQIDPAELERLQNAPGFVPVIINIQPLQSLPLFLGLNETELPGEPNQTVFVPSHDLIARLEEISTP